MSWARTVSALVVYDCLCVPQRVCQLYPPTASNCNISRYGFMEGISCAIRLEKTRAGWGPRRIQCSPTGNTLARGKVDTRSHSHWFFIACKRTLSTKLTQYHPQHGGYIAMDLHVWGCWEGQRLRMCVQRSRASLLIRGCVRILRA